MKRCYYHRPEMELVATRHRVERNRASIPGSEILTTQIARARELESELSAAVAKANERAIKLACLNPRLGSVDCYLVAILPSGFVVVRHGWSCYDRFAMDGSGLLRVVFSDSTFGQSLLSIPYDAALPRGVQLPTVPLWHSRRGWSWI